jgi:hypothetical protein
MDVMLLSQADQNGPPVDVQLIDFDRGNIAGDDADFPVPRPPE